jgi:hypothetical protein
MWRQWHADLVKFERDIRFSKKFSPVKRPEDKIDNLDKIVDPNKSGDEGSEDLSDFVVSDDVIEDSDWSMGSDKRYQPGEEVSSFVGLMSKISG